MIHRPAVCLALIVAWPTTLPGNDPAIRPGYRPEQPAASEQEPVESNLIEGFTEPYADINMAAGEMGTLAHVAVKDGDVVRVGQLLANLDDAVLRASLEVARAGMNAEGELRSATTQLELRKVELQKLTSLFERNHASRQELDRIAGEVRIAEARIQSVQEDLAVRRLEFARIEAQLQQRQIRSTIDGVVVEVLHDHGEFVSPSDPVVARVVQLDPLLVVFSVPAARRTEVNQGETVAMDVGTTSGSVTGVVEYVSPTADASSGTFRIKVRLPNPNGIWHGGERSVLRLDSYGPNISPDKQVAKREE
jgi:RND family efflux transporter MFP subunit